MTFTGRVWLFGNHINTDDIIAARYLDTTDERELAAHCMEAIRPDFTAEAKPGDIIVAGENFGCGSSREHAPIAIQARGIAVVVATSFARIFLRNAINIGLPVVELADIEGITDGSLIMVDLDAGTVQGPDRRARTFAPYPEFLQQIIRAGGLMQWIQKTHIT